MFRTQLNTASFGIIYLKINEKNKWSFENKYGNILPLTLEILIWLIMKYYYDLLAGNYKQLNTASFGIIYLKINEKNKWSFENKYGNILPLTLEILIWLIMKYYYDLLAGNYKQLNTSVITPQWWPAKKK